MIGKNLRLAHKLPILIIGLIVLQALALVFVGVMLLPLIAQWHTYDLLIYYHYSENLLQGRLPYHDFALEYPPLALVPFTLPWLAQLAGPLRFSDYVQGFLLQNVLMSTLIALVLAKLCSDRLIARAPRPTLALYALFVACSAPLLPWRYDLFPALLASLALLCVLRGWPAWAGGWVGLGVAAKLYPLVLLPVFGLYYLANRDRRALLRLAAGCALAIVLTLLPFLLLAPAQVFSFLRYHELRGLQLESLPAGLIVLAHEFGLVAVKLEYNFGALHLVSDWATVALGWLPLVLVAVFGTIMLAAWARFRQECAAPANAGQVSPQTLVAYVMAALLAFIATNKVFSPQYIIWLLPFAPLLRLRQAGVFLVIVALTMTLFPFHYNQLIAMEMLPVLVLNLRNVLVLAMLVWLLYERSPALPRSVLPWLRSNLRQAAP